MAKKTSSYNIVHYCQYSVRRETSFELLNTTICPVLETGVQALPLIDNALGGGDSWGNLLLGFPG